jgi:hypothetical protein
VIPYFAEPGLAPPAYEASCAQAQVSHILNNVSRICIGLSHLGLPGKEPLGYEIADSLSQQVERFSVEGPGTPQQVRRTPHISYAIPATMGKSKVRRRHL